MWYCSWAEKGRLVKQAWKEGSIFSQASLRTQGLRLADSSFPHSHHFRPVFRLVGPPHRSDILRTQGHVYHSLTSPFLSTTLSKHSGTEVTSSGLNHNLICSTDWDLHCGFWTYTTRFQWLTGGLQAWQSTTSTALPLGLRWILMTSCSISWPKMYLLFSTDCAFTEVSHAPYPLFRLDCASTSLGSYSSVMTTEEV